jgi:hypothetical protein
LRWWTNFDGLIITALVAKAVIVSVPLAMGLDPGDDLWPDVCAGLAPVPDFLVRQVDDHALTGTTPLLIS